jgi:hypothetical protein
MIDHGASAHCAIERLAVAQIAKGELALESLERPQVGTLAHERAHRRATP